MSKRRISSELLVIGALLSAMSIIFGKFLAINITTMIRISFENLPILLMGFLFGPLAGALVGIVSDLIGCLLVGYAINPIITLGAGCLGLLAGFIYRMPFFGNKAKLRCLTASLIPHFVGSVAVKTLGLYLAYDFPPVIFPIRIGIYFLIGLAEGILIWLLLKTKVLQKVTGGVRK